MKKIVALLLLALTPLMAEVSIVRLSEFDAQASEDFSKGAVILECGAGEKLPFKAFMDGEFLTLEGDGMLYLNIQKTCYIRYENNVFLFSTDTQEWKEFSDFFTGRFGLSLVAEGRQALVQFGLELNQRAVETANAEVIEP